MKSRIKPTAMGWYLIGLILVLLLLSISYSNNLLLIFTLIFLSLSIIWISESFFSNKNIASLKIEVKDFFADELPRISFPEGIDLNFETKGQKINLKALFQRGYYEIDAMVVKTTRPFGLFEYAERVNVRLPFYVFPSRKRLEANHTGNSDNEEKDLTELGKYMEGSPARIHWKHFARTHELVTKEYSEAFSPDLIIEIDENPQEEILSHAAFEVFYAQQSNKSFSLRFKGEEIVDYEEALKRLALC